MEFDASYQGQDVKVVKLSATKKNQPTTVEITKADVTTGVELDGASLLILNKKGEVVDFWTSVKDKPHVIKGLKSWRDVYSSGADCAVWLFTHNRYHL